MHHIGRVQADRVGDPGDPHRRQGRQHQGRRDAPAQAPQARQEDQGPHRPEDPPALKGDHVVADLPQQEGRAGDHVRPEAVPRDDLLIALEAGRNAGPPGEQETERQRDRHGRREEDLETAPGQGRNSEPGQCEGRAFGLGEDGGAQEETGRDPLRQLRARARFQEQHEAGAIEAGERQVAEGPGRTAAPVESRERQQSGRQTGERRGLAARPALGTVVEHQQPRGEEKRVQGPVERRVVPRLAQLQHGGLGHGQEERIPGMGDVPARLREDARVDRALGPDVAGLRAPGHAPVPLHLRVGQGVGEDAEREEHGHEHGDLRQQAGPAPARAEAAVLLPFSPQEPGDQARQGREGGHGEDGGPPQGDAHEVGERVEDARRPGDPQEPGVGEPPGRRQDADCRQHLGETGAGNREQARARQARQGFRGDHRPPSAGAGRSPGR